MSEPSSLSEILEILSKNFGEKDECKSGDCRLNRKGVKAIFSPEVYLSRGILNVLKNEQFKIDNENPNLCDCIVLCCNGEIYVVEILCGELTEKEVSSKRKQVEACITAVKYVGLEVNFGYVIYLSLDIKKGNVKRFKRMVTGGLNIKGVRVHFRSLEELKDKKQKRTKAFLICGKN